LDLSEKLKKLRDDRNWSQQTVADLMSISRSTISRYETGESAPSYERLVKFAELYQVDKEYLVGDSSQNKYVIEENLTNPDLSIIYKLFELEPELKKALIDLYLIAPKQRSFVTNAIVGMIKGAKKI
jgi:transcriptional regulator with XRE-family HTH domain